MVVAIASFATGIQNCEDDLTGPRLHVGLASGLDVPCRWTGTGVRTVSRRYVGANQRSEAPSDGGALQVEFSHISRFSLPALCMSMPIISTTAYNPNQGVAREPGYLCTMHEHAATACGPRVVTPAALAAGENSIVSNDTVSHRSIAELVLVALLLRVEVCWFRTSSFPKRSEPQPRYGPLEPTIPGPMCW